MLLKFGLYNTKVLCWQPGCMHSAKFNCKYRGDIFASHTVPAQSHSDGSWEVPALPLPRLVNVIRYFSICVVLFKPHHVHAHNIHTQSWFNAIPGAVIILSCTSSNVLALHSQGATSLCPALHLSYLLQS